MPKATYSYGKMQTKTPPGLTSVKRPRVAKAQETIHVGITSIGRGSETSKEASETK